MVLDRLLDQMARMADGNCRVVLPLIRVAVLPVNQPARGGEGVMPGKRVQLNHIPQKIAPPTVTPTFLPMMPLHKKI